MSGAGPAASDGYDRRRFLQRSAALSAAAEDRLLAVVGAYQAITDRHLRRPPEPPAAAARAHAAGAGAAPQLTPEDVIEQTQ